MKINNLLNFKYRYNFEFWILKQEKLQNGTTKKKKWYFSLMLFQNKEQGEKNHDTSLYKMVAKNHNAR